MAKETGLVRVGADIPEELHKKITEYNKTATRPINMSRVFQQALEVEYARVKAEKNATPEITVIKDKRGMKVIGDGFFQCICDYYIEHEKPEDILKFFLATINGEGYILGADLLLLHGKDIDIESNEVRIQCQYSENTYLRGLWKEDEITVDNDFFISITPFSNVKCNVKEALK